MRTYNILPVLLFSCLLSSSSVAGQDGDLLHTFFKIFHSLVSPHTEFQDLIRIKDKFIQEYPHKTTYDPDSLPFFKFIPKYLTTLAPNTEEDITGTCFESVKIQNEILVDNSTIVSVHLGKPGNLLCHASFIFSSGSEVFVKELWQEGTHQVPFSSPTTEAEMWDMLERGPRVFLYPISPEIVTLNLAATLALFEPCLTKNVGDTFADLNREFLSAFAGIEMNPRSEDAPKILEIPAEMIKNGDTFDIMRLDGLDPMIAWAMGAATGHTAVALWKDDELFICESNALSPYWPVNGIQCTPYHDWLEYGADNGYNTVWAPLEKDKSDALNITAAWEFVDAMLGVDYGYEVVLTGLLDTLYDNMPCAGSDQTMCLEPEHLEFLFSYVERVSKVAARVFKPAVMQRAGVAFDRPILEAYYQAHKAGIAATELPLIPEQDGWVYETTRYGEPEHSPVMICNVFVCNVWKAGGLFGDIGDKIECGETSVNDNYRLNIYSTQPPPEVCSAVDQDNPLCQVLGKYQLRLDSQPGVLPRYNYVQPQPHLLERCPSKAPDYLAPVDC